MMSHNSPRYASRLGPWSSIRTAAISASLALVTVLFGSIPWASADSGTYVRTQSGRVRCLVMANDEGHGGGPAVVCEASGPMSPPWDQWDNKGFLQAPLAGPGGMHVSDAVVNAAGAFQWLPGANIGAARPANDVILNYGQSYHIDGWTIIPGPDGTRFTNDGTGHGMFVSIENVYVF